MEKNKAVQFNPERTREQVIQTLMRKDDDSRRLHSFMNVYAQSPEEMISLAVIQFYFDFHNNKDVNKLLISGISSESLQRIAFAYYMTPGLTEIESEFKSYFNLVSEENDLEKYRFGIISDNFDIGKNILEVGCGVFPSVARYVDRKQMDLGKGSVTCYDSALQIKNDGNIKLVRENIKPTENIQYYDYMYAFNACGATDTFLELARRNQKDFVLGLCACPQKRPDDFYDVMIFDNNDGIRKIYNKLSAEYKERLIAINQLYTAGIIDLLDETIDFKMYAIYLITKLELSKNQNVEYQLSTAQDKIPPVIVKRKLKTLF